MVFWGFPKIRGFFPFSSAAGCDIRMIYTLKVLRYASDLFESGVHRKREVARTFTRIYTTRSYAGSPTGDSLKSTPTTLSLESVTELSDSELSHSQCQESELPKPQVKSSKSAVVKYKIAHCFVDSMTTAQACCIAGISQEISN